MTHSLPLPLEYTNSKIKSFHYKIRHLFLSLLKNLEFYPIKTMILSNQNNDFILLK